MVLKCPLCKRFTITLFVQCPFKGNMVNLNIICRPYKNTTHLQPWKCINCIALSIAICTIIVLLWDIIAITTKHYSNLISGNAQKFCCKFRFHMYLWSLNTVVTYKIPNRYTNKYHITSFGNGLNCHQTVKYHM